MKINRVKLFRGLSVTTISELKTPTPMQPLTKIKNSHIPSCKNCVFYRPDYLYGDFTSPYNKCKQFGEKNIVTDEIEYEYAKSCRKNENQCGEEGKYFIEETNISTKIILYKILAPYSIIPIVLVTIICIKTIL